VIVGKRTRGARRQWSDIRHGARLNVHLTAVWVDDVRGPIGANHDGIANVRLHATVDSLEALSSAEGDAALNRLDGRGLGQGATRNDGRGANAADQ
jgi:hypothetical protein